MNEGNGGNGTDLKATSLSQLLSGLKDDSLNYPTNILLSLELNKLEARLQRYKKPVVYLRRANQIGIMQAYIVNPIYAGQVPDPRRDFVAAEFAWLIRYISNPRHHKLLELWLQSCQLEMVFQTEEKSPMFKKRFNVYGFPTDYSFNWKLYRIAPEEYLNFPAALIVPGYEQYADKLKSSGTHTVRDLTLHTKKELQEITGDHFANTVFVELRKHRLNFKTQAEPQGSLAA